MRFALLLPLFCVVLTAQPSLNVLNHTGPLLDAHNCYPYEGRWADRIERALSLGTPVAIEQDLAWFEGQVVVSHTPKTRGDEPTLRKHFFERVRPMMEKALAENDRKHWPLIVVHFDFKDNQPALLHAVWDLLGEYQGWITTAAKTANPGELSALNSGPLLVLTEDSDAQEEVFFRQVAVGAKLRLFGSAHTGEVQGANRKEKMHFAATASPELLLAESPTNYRRWWNNSWFEVEEGGQSAAGPWTPEDDQRLRALVNHAHKRGFWIRFYTLDGFGEGEDRGWGQAYNFRSRAAVEQRWRAVLDAGVDLIATDQYEDLAKFMRETKHAEPSR